MNTETFDTNVTVYYRQSEIEDAPGFAYAADIVLEGIEHSLFSDRDIELADGGAAVDELVAQALAALGYGAENAGVDDGATDQSFSRLYTLTPDTTLAFWHAGRPANPRKSIIPVIEQALATEAAETTPASRRTSTTPLREPLATISDAAEPLAVSYAGMTPDEIHAAWQARILTRSDATAAERDELSKRHATDVADEGARYESGWDALSLRHDHKREEFFASQRAVMEARFVRESSEFDAVYDRECAEFERITDEAFVAMDAVPLAT